MIAALFAAMRLAAVPVAGKVFVNKATVQAFKRPYLLAAINRLVAAGSIFTGCYLLDIYCLVHASFAMIYAINTTDY